MAITIPLFNDSLSLKSVSKVIFPISDLEMIKEIKRVRQYSKEYILGLLKFRL